MMSEQGLMKAFEFFDFKRIAEKLFAKNILSFAIKIGKLLIKILLLA